MVAHKALKMDTQGAKIPVSTSMPCNISFAFSRFSLGLQDSITVIWDGIERGGCKSAYQSPLVPDAGLASHGGGH